MGKGVYFTVLGNPIPKQSFRYSGRGNFTPPRVKAWQDSVRLAANNMMQLNRDMKHPYMGDIRVRLRFFRQDHRKVDLDNLSKAVLDAMNGIVYNDDQQIVHLEIEKHYCPERPGVEICVQAIESMAEQREYMLAAWQGGDTFEYFG